MRIRTAALVAALSVAPVRDSLAQAESGDHKSDGVFHPVAETLNWLNKYVKNATSNTTTDSAAVQ